MLRELLNFFELHNKQIMCETMPTTRSEPFLYMTDHVLSFRVHLQFPKCSIKILIAVSAFSFVMLKDKKEFLERSQWKYTIYFVQILLSFRIFCVQFFIRSMIAIE